jgi:ATP-dependent Clp protease ATP-binding subunit ClpA
MFERFSDSSIRAIMLAQEKARKLGLSQIDSQVVLYGILCEGTSKAAQILGAGGLSLSALDQTLEKRYSPVTDRIAPEIPFNIKVERAFSLAGERSANLGSQTVEPEHILYELLVDPQLNSFLISSLFIPSGLIAGALFRHMHGSLCNEESLKQRYQQSSIRPGTLPAALPRKLNEWFTTEAIQAVVEAQKCAQAEGSDKIKADHLLSALIPACTWIPPRVLASCAPASARSAESDGYAGSDQHAGSHGLARSEAQQNTNAEDPDAKAFAEEIVSIFINARAEAANFGSSRIGPGHLLLGLLKSVDKGQVESCFSRETVTEELYHLVKGRFVESVKTHLSTRPQALVEPLVVDTDRVRATTRFVSTIKRAQELAFVSNQNAVEIPHLVRALIESARSSEVAFVQNHTTSLKLVEEVIEGGNPDGNPDIKKKPKKGKKKAEADKLQSIVRRAADHAKRLHSNRLDINHLGLALLDEESVAVDSVVNALGQSNSRGSLRRRLDWCLLFQRYQQGYQSEPGEVINLRELDRLHPDC